MPVSVLLMFGFNLLKYLALILVQPRKKTGERKKCSLLGQTRYLFLLSMAGEVRACVWCFSLKPRLFLFLFILLWGSSQWLPWTLLLCHLHPNGYQVLPFEAQSLVLGVFRKDLRSHRSLLRILY